MTAQYELVLETEQQVLADGFDGEQALAVEPLGNPLRGGTRVRRLDRDALADERLEAGGGTVKGVSLWHRRPRYVRCGPE